MKPNAAHDDMATWWNRAIETNVEALEQIVILHILRPAEFAMCRLILIAAAQIHVAVPPIRATGGADGEPAGARQRRAEGEALKGGTKNLARQRAARIAACRLRKCGPAT
jgi:hypothetical protein